MLAPVGTTFKAVRERVEGRRFGRAPSRRAKPPGEPRSAGRPRVRIALPVARPRLLLAYKDTPAGSGRALLRRQLASSLALDCLFGNSGSINLKLYEQGLVDDTFSCSYTADRGYGFAMLGGETDDPTATRRVLAREIERARVDGLSDAEFLRVRNKVLGDYARAFNSPDRIAHMMVGHHLRGTELSDYRGELFRLTRRALNRRLRDLLDPATCCYSVVVPKK